MKFYTKAHDFKIIESFSYVLLYFARGSGSLLINVKKHLEPNSISQIYGQKNITTYNLARMNMLLHGFIDSEFTIFHGDSLLNDWSLLNEMNPAKKLECDAVVANPPFSYRWEPMIHFLKIFVLKVMDLHQSRQLILHSCYMSFIF